MLRTLEAPRNVIDTRIAELRADTQTTDRRATVPRPRLGELGGLADMKVETFLVQRESAAVGASPMKLELRTRTGALVVGIRRDGELVESPDPAAPFQPGDVVFLVGTLPSIERALATLSHGPPPDEPPS